MKNSISKNNTKLRVEYIPSKEYLFSKETIASLGELGRVLERIQKRLLKEGYTLMDGKLTKT